MSGLKRFGIVLLALVAVLCVVGFMGYRAAAPGDGQLHVLSFVHFNTNVSNFAAAREFYGKLGFSTVSGFPDTNTQAMARAIGIQTPTAYDGSRGGEAGGYLLHGELIALGGFGGGTIDLIEFTIPRNDAPPYLRLNHLGMASAVLLADDLDAAHAFMVSNGVRVLSAPARRADGARFFVLQDLDGTFYEVEQGESASAVEHPAHLASIDRVRVNVSDLERSQAWYAQFGYEQASRSAGVQSAEAAAAMGFEQPVEYRSLILRHRLDGSGLELTQWVDPFDSTPPYPLPVNHIGIHRMALMSGDIAGDVRMLKAQGVPFVSPVTPCCSGDDSWGAIVAFEDPDGTIVELVEQPGLAHAMQVALGVGRLF